MRATPMQGTGHAAVVLVAVGVWMAAMPFAGPVVGLAFDGSDAFEWNRNRFLLHVLPGLLGAAAGLALLHRRWLPALAVGALVLGVWNGAGPWLLDALLPATAEGSALMFQAIPDFHGFSTAHQLALEAACHWIPGWVTLAAAWAVWRLARGAQPLADPA